MDPTGEQDRRVGLPRDRGEPVTAWLLDRLSRHPADRVLEIAAGAGRLTFAAAATGRWASSVCTDIDVAAVAAAAAGYASRRDSGTGARGAFWPTSLDFLAADMQGLPFRDGAFDAILSGWGYMFAPDPVAAFREARRVLQPGGLLVFSVWGPPEANPWQSILDDVLTASGVDDRATQSRPGGMFGLADDAALGAMLEAAGFLVRELESVPLLRRYRNFEEYRTLEVDVGAERPARLRALSPAAAARFHRRLEDGLSAYRGDGGYAIPGLGLAVAAEAPADDA